MNGRHIGIGPKKAISVDLYLNSGKIWPQVIRT